MSNNSSPNKKPVKKSRSFIAMIVIVCLLLAGGLGLILYPFITNIPSYFQKSEHILQWESEKKNEASLEQENGLNNKKERSDFKTGFDDSLSSGKTAPDTAEPDSGKNGEASVSDHQKKQEELFSDTAEDLFPLKISIPKIDVEWITNEGADVPTLRKGPGHIPQTPLPGEEGRCTISGHRTTYGAPFNRIDELEDGDLIYLETLNNKTFAYKVTDIEVVIPTFVDILIGSDKKELLLTTCYPEYSARERMVIISELINIYPLDYNLG